MKKVLFFTYDFPYPTNSGGKMRAYNLMKFANQGFEFSLFSFTRPDFDEKAKEHIEKIGIKPIRVFSRKSVKHIQNFKSIVSIKSSIFKTLYYSPHIEEALLQAVKQEKIDIVLFESLYTSYYMSDKLKELGVKQIYGTENIEYKNYDDFLQKIPVLLRLPFKTQVSKIKKEEIEFAKKSDITLAVTDEEAQFFKENGAKQIAVIPNGVNVTSFKFKPSTRLHGEKMLFVGNFSYFPNRDAMMFFYNEVFKHMAPGYKLKIIGKGGKQLNISDPRVEFVDYIPDIRDAYYEADVLVSPIRIGGGTNFKVLEAMACGLPVVAHVARAKSFRFTSGEELLVADSAKDFQEKLEMLLNNDGMQGKLAKNARVFIEKNYSWEVIGKKLNAVLKDVSK